MFRRDLELTADVIADEILEKLLVLIENQIIETNARANKDFFNTGQTTARIL